MPMIAVAPNKFQKGVDGPDSEWIESFKIIDLKTALAATYRTDAHAVCYWAKNRLTQPRCNKQGIDYLLTKGVELFADVILVDIDNPDHAKWTSETEAVAIAQYDRWEADGVLSWGIYHTSKGARFVQPLDEPVPIDEFEEEMGVFREHLKTLGVIVDETCRDWTRHFRMPNVRRDGKPYRSSYVKL